MIKKFQFCETKRPIELNLYLKTLEDRLTTIFKLENENKVMKENR